MSTIQSTRAPAHVVLERISARPAGVCGLSILALEAAFAAVGAEFPLLAGLALIVAPGLLLVPLLPAAARQDPLVTLAAVPALGFAGSSVLLITASAIGVPLEPVPIRVLLLGFAVAMLLLPLGPERIGPATPAVRRAALALGGVVVLGVFLQQRVIGGYPVPGNDWAKYLLYADEIRTHGSLLIDNPFWFLGLPFLEDPGVPAVYGSYLVLGGQATAVLAHGIWVFAVAGILSTFAFVRALWGLVPGVLAAAFWAALPMSQDILGWHGLANVAALALLPVLLLYLAGLANGTATRADMIGLGLLTAALVATHRFSSVVGVAAMGVVIGAALALQAGRRELLVRTAQAALAALVIGAGVVYDALERSDEFGGYQGYRAYLSQKLALGPVIHDLTIPFSIVAVGAVGAAIVWVRRDRRLVLPLAMTAVIAVLAYAWVFHLPLYYIRMAYFLPLALTPLVAVALVRVLGARRGAMAGAALTIAMAVIAAVQAGNVRGFYEFATPGSLRGLDALSKRLQPGDVVVTDRCWSFLATWLLRTDTLAALEPADIQPKVEVRRAALARKILTGTPDGQRLAREFGVRYLVVNPRCIDTKARALVPPVIGRPVYLQRDLVIIELPRGSGAPAA